MNDLNSSIKRKNMVDENEEYKRCVYCEAYDNCDGAPCPYVLDLALLGVRSYKSLIENYVHGMSDVYFRRRMKRTVKIFNGNWFHSQQHKERFHLALAESELSVEIANNKQISSLYLLTAENPLWQMAKQSAKYPSFTPCGKDIEGATSDQYALFHVAKSAAEGVKYPHLIDLASDSLVSFPIFFVIARGLLLAKHGGELLDLKK